MSNARFHGGQAGPRLIFHHVLAAVLLSPVAGLFHAEIPALAGERTWTVQMFQKWMALLGEGTELLGKAGKGDGRFSLKEDVQAVVFYSGAMEKGAIYAYPEVYAGADHFKNAIWDRKRDNKLYFRPAINGKYGVGDRFEFQLQVIPFSATPDDWKSMARKLNAQG